LQNDFVIGDDFSSSDGNSITISDDEANENPAAQQQQAATDDLANKNPAAQQQQAATEARRGQRTRMPPNFYQAE
jgi:hypothetical protein